MKLEWLEAVSAVARLRSFSEAAETIPCAQSSVSRHIRSAEDELGITIFDRSSNSNLVSLTADGERVLPLIEKLLEDWGALQRTIDSQRGHKPRTIRLGLDKWMYSSSNKGNLISLLYLAYPEVMLSIKEIAAVNRLGPLLSQKVDAVLEPRAVLVGQEYQHRPDDESIRYELVGMQPLSIAYGEAFAPTDRDNITLRELEDQPIIFHTDIVKQYDPSNLNRERHNLFVKACLDSGFEPLIKLVDRDLADIKQSLTAQGKGVFPSTIPPGLREYPGIRYVPVSDAPYSMQYYLLSRAEDKNPAISKLADALQECFRKK